MSLDDKAARGCRCMGVNALHQASCNFPGVGSFYDPVVDQPRPTAPAASTDTAGNSQPPQQPSQNDTAAFHQALADWEVKRSTVVSQAESLISRFHKDFGWAFVDKHNRQAFWSKIFTTWGAQALIITTLLGLIFLSVSLRNRV